MNSFIQLTIFFFSNIPRPHLLIKNFSRLWFLEFYISLTVKNANVGLYKWKSLRHSRGYCLQHAMQIKSKFDLVSSFS